MTDIFKSADWAREAGTSGKAVLARDGETIETNLRHEIFVAILRHLESAYTADILTTPLARDLTDKVMEAVKAATPRFIVSPERAAELASELEAIMRKPSGVIVVDDPREWVAGPVIWGHDIALYKPTAISGGCR